MKDIIQEYKDAYRDLHGEEPKVTRRSSWFYINDDLTGRRKSELKPMAEELRQRRKKRKKGRTDELLELMLTDDGPEIGHEELAKTKGQKKTEFFLRTALDDPDKQEEERERRQSIINSFLEKDKAEEESSYEHPFMKQGKYLEDGVYLYVCQKCGSSVPLQDVICEFTYCPSCGYAGAMSLQNCHDCGAEPGEPHNEGCDVERCSVCGRRRIMCHCEGHDPQFARWTGFSPGEAEAKLIGVCLNEFYDNYSRTFFVKPTSKPKVLIRIPKEKMRKRTLPREPEPMNEDKPHLKLDFETKLDERLMQDD